MPRHSFFNPCTDTSSTRIRCSSLSSNRACHNSRRCAADRRKRGGWCSNAWRTDVPGSDARACSRVMPRYTGRCASGPWSHGPRCWYGTSGKPAEANIGASRALDSKCIACSRQPDTAAAKRFVGDVEHRQRVVVRQVGRALHVVQVHEVHLTARVEQTELAIGRRHQAAVEQAAIDLRHHRRARPRARRPAAAPPTRAAAPCRSPSPGCARPAAVRDPPSRSTSRPLGPTASATGCASAPPRSATTPAAARRTRRGRRPASGESAGGRARGHRRGQATQGRNSSGRCRT